MSGAIRIARVARTMCFLAAGLLAAVLGVPDGHFVRAEELPGSGPTFHGEIQHVLDPPVGAGGGTIRLTLTPDLTGITRAAVDDFDATGLVEGTGSVVEFHFSKVQYFNPPVAVVSGAFTVSLSTLTGSVVEQVELEGTVLSETEIAGTARWSCSICGEFPAAPWTATGPVETPPASDDTLIRAEVEDGGLLVLTMDDVGNVTSFVVQDVVFAPCIERSITLHAFFEQPQPPEQGATVEVGFTEGDYLLSVADIERAGEEMSGRLVLSGYYLGDCQATRLWATRMQVTATPTESIPTPRPLAVATETPHVPALPDTGGAQGASGGRPLPVLLVLAAAGALAAVVGVGALTTRA